MVCLTACDTAKTNLSERKARNGNEGQKRKAISQMRRPFKLHSISPTGPLYVILNHSPSPSPQAPSQETHAPGLGCCKYGGSTAQATALTPFSIEIRVAIQR